MNKGFNNDAKRGAFSKTHTPDNITGKIQDEGSQRFMKIAEAASIQKSYDRHSGKVEGAPSSYKGTTYDPSQTDQGDAYQ